jgi:hypothetical protein
MGESLLDWIVGEVQEAKDGEQLLAFLSQLGSSADRAGRPAEGRALLEKCGGTVEGVVRAADMMRPGFVQLAKTLDLPPDRVTAEFRREELKLAGNPVYKVFAPVVHNVRVRRSSADIRRRLLSAAIAVRLDGRDALEKHPEPLTGEAFEYAPFEGGFELRSKWKPGLPMDVSWGMDPLDPLVIVVGRRVK